MSKRLLAGVAVLTLACASPMLAAATGHAKRTCSVNLIAKATEIETTSGNPPASGSNIGAAIVDGKLCGRRFHGALRDVNHFPTLGKANGTGTLFGPLGSIGVRFVVTATINPDHSDSLHAKTTITGGTGAYKHATGSGFFTGKQPANSPVTTEHLTGQLTY